MLIDKAGIARLIPHSGAMCLLDGVLRWDEANIRCVTDSHRNLANPLRRNGRLNIIAGVEYAAQAMALHGALTAGGAARSHAVPAGAGYLASVRDLVCHIQNLDTVSGTLTVVAERLHGDSDRAIYGFALRHEDRTLLDGRAAVVMKATGA